MVAQLCYKLLKFLALLTTVQDHHDEKVKRSTELTRELRNLKAAADQKAKRFLDEVGEVRLHCSDESELMTAAKEGVNLGVHLVVKKVSTPKFQALNDLINQLEQNMSMAGSYLNEFKGNCGNVITCCTRAAEVCGCKAKEAADGKETAKETGAVVVITSIAVAVVTGCTFGIGLVVVCSALAGVGAAVVTIYLVHELDQSKVEYERIGTHFHSLLDAMCAIEEEVNAIEVDRVRVSGLLDNLILRRNIHDSIESVQIALHHLGETGAKVQRTISRCRQCIESRVQKLPQI